MLIIEDMNMCRFNSFRHPFSLHQKKYRHCISKGVHKISPGDYSMYLALEPKNKLLIFSLTLFFCIDLRLNKNNLGHRKEI